MIDNLSELSGDIEMKYLGDLFNDSHTMQEFVEEMRKHYDDLCVSTRVQLALLYNFSKILVKMDVWED